ncbi:MAG: FG-GAP repeat domain-containing protein [Gemmataceae bacterium]
MKRRGRGWWSAFIAVLVACTTAAAAYLYLERPIEKQEPLVLSPASQSVASPLEIENYCSKCHAFPPADSFPRSSWKEEVEKAYKIIAQSNMNMNRLAGSAPSPEQVINYYEERAPLDLPPAIMPRATGPLPVRFRRENYPVAPQAPEPAVANVNLVHLFDKRRLDILACDMRAGLVIALRPYAPSPAWEVLGAVPNPCHAEVVDLDGDGVKDILVANLGSMQPADHYDGSVVWLRGNRDGGFTPITLLKNVGRVADVQAADFRGVGKLDLVVAEFGLFRTGRILYLENQTTDWSHPVFVPRVLDDRHGTIHVPVADLNGDGRPDFVALISQEHETIVAFLNEGNGQFRKETIYTAPHPAYGSSGIQLVDLNGDGRPDVLYTNGDTMDPPYLLKPYHGIQWLENQGHFPFVHHPIAPMYGVHRAVAADFRGNGRVDIVAVSYLPPDRFPQRSRFGLDAVIYLEQIAPGRFARHSLETTTCDHVTCVAGDISGKGRIDLVTGNFVYDPADHAISIWKNLGRP